MAISKLEVEIELKSSAEKFWRNLKEFATFFPKALPHMYESIEILEGDGKSVGSVLLATLKPELKSAVSTTKERIELVDEEKRTLSYSFLEGKILKYYKNFKAIVCVSTKGDGALIKYSAEFEKANEQVPDPDLFRDFVVKLFHDLDAFLLKA